LSLSLSGGIGALSDNKLILFGLIDHILVALLAVGLPAYFRLLVALIVGAG